MRVRRQLTDLLIRRGPRLVALAGSVRLSMRHRTRCRVRYDHGDWIFRYPEGTVVNTSLMHTPPAAEDRIVADLFLHGYRPRPGDTVLDLGAGVGGEVRLFSRLVGPHGRVVAVEGHPRTFRCLRRAVALNGLANVTLVPCAVVDEPGTVRLDEHDQTHLRNALTRDGRGGVEVPGRTLAEIMSTLDLDRVDLLKMNIEGAELPALRGSSDALRHVRNLAVSCHDFLADGPGREWQRTFEGVTEVLREAGFTIRTRPDDPRPWVPYYVYASRPALVGHQQ
ncbi:FkbM family methyltransferase [Micromonospora sp. NPDC050980]|uniref:FkbM family methyltransferase n=1 Tax=Micromonospora sp. NPDC050980 TaxID=3155161 RepID=UPI0033D83909